jgi:hypothetical protein
MDAKAKGGERGKKLVYQLNEFQEQYLERKITLNELALFCCRAGIDATQAIFNDTVFTDLKKGKV